ncbi:polysaccharide biosynthesis C-terminal domain-containing protein [Halalkalibacter kiskunsagensis]|uniref:Polysaccharide biosynthesis C-terminal domain-containing protein n=1 Tax=Halalkalibacter kiskunsagensis TaxID=1548599 RepID=A0ABV6KDU8_9BACI
MSDSKLVRGTALLTAATFLSRLIGLIYVIPFTAIVGQLGNTLYGYGFIPYSVMLSMATLGVPMAVSKFVSKYRNIGDHKTGYQLLKYGMLFMFINGLIAFFILYFSAPTISNWIIEDPEALEGYTMEDIIFTIRMVSVALLIVPVMAIVRGYFQGHQSMGPTAVSQVIEQILRIAFILSATIVIYNVMGGELGTAVGFATLGAFVGALGGMGVLLIYWMKRRSMIMKEIKESTVIHSISLKEMYKEVIGYALPISFVGLAIPLFQLIDMFTVSNALTQSGFMSQDEADTFFAIFTQTAHKVVLIPMTLATAFSITLIPTITKSFVTSDQKALQQQITKTFKVILFFTIPAVVGLSILSYSAFGALFKLDDIDMGGMVLRYYAPIALFFSLFSISSAILQGINKQKYAVRALVCGLLVKFSLNYFLLHQFGPLGGVLATYLGFGVAIVITLLAISKYANYQYRLLIKQTRLILLFVGIMGVYVAVVSSYFQRLFPLETWMNTVIVLIAGVSVGGITYILFSVRFGLVRQILGDQYKNRFVKLKKQKEG